MPHRPAPAPHDEEERVLSLEHLDILDSAPEQNFDDVVLLATTLCDTPIALVSLVDRERQWFKACVGLDVRETHRDLAFCAHAILEPDDVLVVEDATQDPRFQHSALVLGEPHIRFYAGAPIRTDAGHPLGTVCVIDTKPRSLPDHQRRALQALARQTAALLQLRMLELQRERHASALLDELEQAQARHREAEESLRHARRVSSLGMLTASIAHDVNNLLQVLSTSLQMAQLRARRPAEVERFAQTGLQAVEQGGKLIRQLLANVRQDGPELACVDISERLHKARELLAGTLGDAITLSFDLAARDVGVMCDEVQLQAVVLNLLSNARDAMQGRGQVVIATRQEQLIGDEQLSDGNYLVLSVQDDGPGMSAELAARVFDPFFTTKQAGKGTGLGLAQAREFANTTGGDVRVLTAPGTGTTMQLYLRILGRISGVDRAG
ncbi:sensor histidine kinase [Pseudomonas sp. sia0905]|uniref:sensor histidine kinase n=1 Tax=Pseudomonas sp. sia0905 TaxID=2854783 RepID=UPI001C455696|nr:ATP-binding protein [Pseudomonas sp. sia0905]MBV7563907.1 GAF domain-containing protein [Pseudomonas sp. sia0905]